jgi:dsRNA-specific ribonuclease
MSGTSKDLIESIGCNTNLARVAREIGLDEHIVQNPGHFRRPLEKSPATTLEAVLNAIDCDSGQSANAVRCATERVGLTAVANV